MVVSYDIMMLPGLCSRTQLVGLGLVVIVVVVSDVNCCYRFKFYPSFINL